MAEQNETGIYNATGPARELGIGEMLESMRPLARTPLSLTFVDADFLEAHEVRAWADLPTWVPPRGETAGFARISIQRALQKGLRYRPVATTAADTLLWFESLPAERQEALQAGLPAEREKQVLDAWSTRATG